MSKNSLAPRRPNLSLCIAIALICAFAAFSVGCGGGTPNTIVNRTQTPVATGITITSITPTSGPTTGGTQVTVTGTNFPNNVTASFGGTAATSVVINSSTSATVTTPVHAAGVVDVTVTDTATNTSATLTGVFTYFAPGTALQITTTSPLPDVVVNTAYNQQIVAVGGNGTTKTFSLTAGTLPVGITLSSNGLLSGTPTVSGATSFTVQVADQTGSTTQVFTLNVAAPLVITTQTALQDAIVGGAYTQPIATTGGSGTQIWSISAGALPPGLTLGLNTGIISGSPTTIGSFSFTAAVQDALQNTSKAFTLNVNAPLRISGATQGKAFLFTPPAVAGATWSLSGGALPNGVNINATDGSLSGTPTVAGTFTVTLTATVGASSTTSTGFLIVSPTAPVIGNTGNAYLGETPANLDPAATAVAACGSLNANTSYKLTASLSAGAGNTCLTLNGKNIRLDLQGFTVTGRIGMNADASGVVIFNGTVNCTWTDNGGDAGCVKILSQAQPTGQLRLHHLTIVNSGGTAPSTTGARSIHVDWAPPALTTAITVKIFNVTSSVSNQPLVVRSHNLNVTGNNNVVEITGNDFTCGGDAAACQGAVCDQVSDCRMHGNSMTMAINTTGVCCDSARAMAFDTVTNGETWNNTVTVNNNRAVRVRDSTNVNIHDNVFNAIKNGTGTTTPYVAAVHLGDPDFGTDDLNVVVQSNTFQIDTGMGIFIRNGIDADVKNNVVTCTGACTGGFAVLRTPQVIACTPGTVRPGLICDGTTYQTIIQFESQPTVGTAGLPSPQIQVAPGTSATVCKSGTAGAGPGGTGTIVNTNGCP